MRYSFVASLQCMAATRIATLLWNRADIVALIAELKAPHRGPRWCPIEVEVNKKVSLLRLPATLREKVLNVVKPMGEQIKRWQMTHFKKFFLENMPREFCWTSRGMLDKMRTAEAFVRDLTLPERERYHMACMYCIEVPMDNPVPFRGTRYPPLSKFQPSFNTTGQHSRACLPRDNDPVLFHGTGSPRLNEFLDYWVANTAGDAIPLDSNLQRAFRCAVQCGCEVAAEYFFRKLSPGKRRELLSDIKLSFDVSDFGLFRFLLLHMDEGQRSKLLEARGEKVLESLLQWPWQPLFLDVARRVGDTLKSYQYSLPLWTIENYEYSLSLSTIANKIRRGYKDYDYGELFGALWVQMPPDLKEKIRNGHSWKLLFAGVGGRNISLMLQDLSPEQRERFIFSDSGIDVCVSLARGREWDALECFVGECITSRDKMIDLKKICERRGCIFGNVSFEFLDELIEKWSENGGREEADCPVPNRLYSSSQVSNNRV